MIGLLLAVGATALVLLLCACNGGSDENAVSSRPTLTAVPTATPLDPNLGCGPPLVERYCAEYYRPPPASCHVSGVWPLANVGYGIGRPPVWMVASPVTGWTPAPKPNAAWKTIWIVHSDVEGEVILSGRRLDGPEVATFPYYEQDPDALEQRRTRPRHWDRAELILVPPQGRDQRTEVYFPSPGCWQFTARTEQETVEIVLYLYPLDTP